MNESVPPSPLFFAIQKYFNSVCAACVRQNATPPASAPKHAASLLGRSSSATAGIHASSHQQQRLPLGMWQTIRYLVSEPAVVATAAVSAGTTAPHQQPVAASSRIITAGWTRLFRGVQTILIGCIPAHALYFSSYEMVKAAFTDKQGSGEVSAVGSSLAGAAAVTAHDLIMTPLDTLKQRLQLGHYGGVAHAFREVTRTEGAIALYRSFPITLVANVPYGMVMVSTHEACKQFLFSVEHNKNNDRQRRPQWQIVLGSSSVAGLVASAVTTPLDRIKTALQTQQLAPKCRRGLSQEICRASIAPKHVNWQQAAATIWREEGAAGFVRGMTPRILSHTPAVAISWTTYETAKQYLLSSHHHHDDHHF